MPVFRKKGAAWQLMNPPAGLKPNEEVFVVRATKEVFRDYETFLARTKLYEEEVWACKYTGKGGLTYEQAQEEEKKALAALDKFPAELEEQVCRAIHHSLHRTDELVGRIYDTLRHKDQQQQQQQQHQLQQQSPSPLATKENEGPQRQQQQAEAAQAEAGTAQKPDVPAPADEGGAAGAAAAAAAGEPAALDSGQAELTAQKAGEGPAAGPITSKKARGPKAPVSRPLLRTFLLENAEQQGPEHATKQVWVLKSVLRERYGLPAEVPAEVQAQLDASVKAPKEKKEKKEKKAKEPKGPKEAEEGAQPKQVKPKKSNKALAAAAGEGAGEEQASGTPGTSKKTKKAQEGSSSKQRSQPGSPGADGQAAAEGDGGEGSKKERREKEEVLKVKKQVTPLEDLEKHFRPNTVKRYIFEVLKAVQPEALTAAQIIEKAKELGVHEFDAEKGPKSVAHALNAEPEFVRVSKGAYSLHCFHPDLVVMVKPPQPKKAAAEAEERGREGQASKTPGTSKQDQAAAKGADGQGSKEEREEAPKMRKEVTPLEELEKHFRPNTLKRYVFEVLKAVQPEVLTAVQIIEKAKELGVHEFDAEKGPKSVAQALNAEPEFVRISKGAYSLHCFHPDLVVMVKAPQPKKRKLEGAEEEGEAAKQAKGDAGSSPQAAGAAVEEEEEGDPVARAERLVATTKKALVRHRKDLAAASQALEEAKAAYAAGKKQLKSPAKVRESDIHIPSEKLAEFELKPEERDFTGEPDDRKGLMEHRQKLHARVKELDAAKKAYIAAEMAKREKANAAAQAPLKPLEAALRKAERDLAHARRAVESAEKAAAAAEKKLEKSKGQIEKHEQKAKEREEKEKQKAAEREERERRRAEAAKAKEEAKRYPIDDLELLEELRARAAAEGQPAPAEDVAQPAWLAGEAAGRLATSLFVSDLLTQFGRNLKLPGVNLEHFERSLADAVAQDHSSSSTAAKDEHTAAQLHAIYHGLLGLLLEDARESEEATAQEKRWGAVLSQGTWPEVLRRLVLMRSHAAAEEEQPWRRADEQAALAASMLAFDSADSLTHDQHLALLRYLCNEALDTDKMRGILQRRLDEVLDAKKEVRGELAEERKKLKELQDAEREEKRKRREEERRKQEEERAAKEAAAAAAEGQPAEGEGAGTAATTAGDRSAPLSRQPSGAAAMEVDKPSFELPEKYREYCGPADDKKALLAWRQEAQAERRRLEKERSRWMAEQLRRQRELEAEERAARKAEEEKQREKEEAQEAILRAQEELEARLEKFSTRRLPLGLDRHFRRYWWGLAGQKAAVWVEDEQGRLGTLSTLSEVAELVASLDHRGHRELALAEAFEKRWDMIAAAMQKAERERAKAEKEGKPKERPAPQRASGRDRQQVEFYSPSKAGSSKAAGARAGDAAAAVGLDALFGPAEAAAVEAAADELMALQKAAIDAEVDAPADSGGSWKSWGASIKAAAAGSPKGGAKPGAAGVRAALQQALLQAEQVLLGEAEEEPEDDAEQQGEENEEDEGSEEAPGSAEGGKSGGMSRSQSFSVVEEVVDELFSPTRAAQEGMGYLWKTTRERNTWLADVSSAPTAARLAYAAAVLAVQAKPLLAHLRRQRGGGKRGAAGAGKGAKGGAAAAEKKGGGKAGAAADGKLSRNSSTAALDAKGKQAGGSKRKASAPPAESTRVTRARS